MDAVLEVQALEEALEETLGNDVVQKGVNVRSLLTRAFERLTGPSGTRAPHYLIVRVDPEQAMLEQAYRVLAERLPELMQLHRRQLEDQKINALLKAFAPARNDDADHSLVMDNVMARQRFLGEFTCLTSKEVAALSGHKAKNVSMAASRWKQAKKIFSIPAHGEDVYPAFQFQDGKPHRTVALALAELSKRKSPWQIAFWFVSNNGWLDGAAPIARLADAEAVVAAAQHEAEDIVG